MRDFKYKFSTRILERNNLHSTRVFFFNYSKRIQTLVLIKPIVCGMPHVIYNSHKNEVENNRTVEYYDNTGTRKQIDQSSQIINCG